MSTAYQNLTPAQLREEYTAVKVQFDALKAKELKLNMARGKPGREQLDLVSGILSILKTPEDCISGGVDARNYGELSGLKEAKEYWADVLGCKPEECFIGGNASLTLMYDLVSKGYTHGLARSEKPWCRLDTVKWLCPAPGYDRHFKITESFGFELITIPMTPAGPDMDKVEQAVKDPAVKGMWCVPKYSNPDGIIYSDETIARIAALKPAAPDFALMWDNAYCIHEFDGEFVPFRDILTLCREVGNDGMVYEFASTSKVTLPGAGFSVMATSEDNQAYLQKLIGIQTISYDKVNSLRHVRYLKNKAHTLELMKKARGHSEPEVPVRPAPSGHRDRAARHRLLAAAQGRLFRFGQHGSGPCKAHAGAVQRGGRRHDRRRRDVPLWPRPAGFQHPHRPVPAPRSRSWSRPWRSSAPACALPHWSSGCSNRTRSTCRGGRLCPPAAGSAFYGKLHRNCTYSIPRTPRSST